MPAFGAFLAGIGSAISGALAAGGIGAFALRLGGSLLLSALAAKLFAPKPQGLQSRTVTARSPAAPRKFVYGRVREGGTIIFLHSGSDSDYDITFAPREDLTAAEVAASAVPVRVTRVVRLSSGTYAAVARGGPWATARLVDAVTMTEILPPAGYGAVQAVSGSANTVGLIEYELPRSASGGSPTIGFLTSGKTNKHLYLVIALAAHRVRSIGAIYFDGEMAVDAAGVVQDRWDGVLRVEKALGDADQSAFPLLRQDLPSMWTAEHRMRGVAGIALKMTFDQDAYPSGIPNITCDIEGKDDILDPRTGLRGYTTNAMLCVADYMALDTRYSLEATIGAADGIDADDLIEAANICDEIVGTPGGGTERRYTCNGSFLLNAPPQDLVRRLLTSCAGRAAYQGGVWRLRAGAYRIPAQTLTVDDARRGLTLQTRISRAESCNGVRGTFVSPDTDWQADDFPAVRSAVYLAEDRGEEKWLDIELPFTISPFMAQRLAKIELERARRQMSIAWPGKLSAWRVGVSDTALVTHGRWGLDAKPFEVTGVTVQLQQDDGGAPQLVPDLVLRETSPLVYDWTASEAKIYAAAPRTTLPSAFDIDPPGGLTVSESLYETRDGTQVKAQVRLDWTPSPSPYAVDHQVEARLQGSEVWQQYARTSDGFAELADWTPGIWEFRVAAVSTLGVRSEWIATTAEIYGLPAPPAALQNVTIQTAGGLAILKWTRSADPDVRIGGSIVIRHSAAAAPSWSTSYSMDRVNGNEAIAIVPLKPGTYLLRAEDSSGQQGPVVTVTTKGAQAVPFAPVAFMQADGTFAGAMTGAASAQGGVLQLGGSVMVDDWPLIDGLDNIDYFGGIGLTGTFTFGSGMDFGTVRRIRLRSDIAVTAVNVLDLIDSRTLPIDTWASFDGTDGAEVDVVVEYRETDDNPASSPAWSNWSRIDSHEILARAVQARAILTTRDPAFTPQVTRLRVHAEEVV